MQGSHMRKIVFVVAVAVLVLVTDAWLSIRTMTRGSALASSADAPPVMTTGAKGPATSLYDDHEIVVYWYGVTVDRVRHFGGDDRVVCPWDHLAAFTPCPNGGFAMLAAIRRALAGCTPGRGSLPNLLCWRFGFFV
jgi:hypothetical protein